MRSLVGSQDAEAIVRLHTKVDVRDRNAEACKDIISRAINQGVPFAELDAETHVHTRAASLMAHDQQEFLFTNCDYHWEALRAFRTHGRKFFRPDVRAYINGLLEGLPMFGRRFVDHGSPYYASLTLPKVCGFHDGLNELRDSLPEPERDDDAALGLNDFLSNLIEALGKIKDAKLDCWFVTG